MYYSDLNEIRQAYELESRKCRITIRWPFQVGIAVYQLAKLRMLEFYYDFLDKYFDRRDFELIQMDMDSNYMAISAKRLKDIVRPELKTELEAQKNVGWLGTSGVAAPQVSKLECESSWMITLCSKCYVDEAENEKISLARRGCQRSRTRSRGSVLRQRWKAAKIWQPTEVSGCRAGRWSLTSRRSWG